MLTDGSIGRIKEFVESHISGKKNYSQFLILESEPVGEGVANPGTMKLEIKPLTDVQHKDELFQDYDANNRKKVRSSFRLPPIYVGSTEDYNRATAQVSKVIADEQVFHPERNAFDEFVNRILLPELGVTYWKFKSNTPDTTDNETLVKLMTAGEKAGGMTPEIARDVMSDVFSKPLPEVTGIEPNIPFSLQLAVAMKGAGEVGAALSSTPGADTTGAATATTPATKSAFQAVEKLTEMRTGLEEVYKSAYDNIWENLHEQMPWGDEEETED
jgi:capsid portal protein